MISDKQLNRKIELCHIVGWTLDELLEWEEFGFVELCTELLSARATIAELTEQLKAAEELDQYVNLLIEATEPRGSFGGEYTEHEYSMAHRWLYKYQTQHEARKQG